MEMPSVSTFVSSPLDLVLSHPRQMTLTQYNVGENQTKNYLSVGESSFPIIYLVFAITNSIMSIFWIAFVWRR